MNGSGQMAAKADVKLKRFNIDEEITKLVENANKMGVTPEVLDLVESFDDCRIKIYKKSAEFAALESIAMESTDPNIASLRQELFTVTKMIHADILSEVMQHYDDNVVKKDYMAEDNSPEMVGSVSNNMPASKWDIMERMRRYLNRRAEYKQFMKRKGR